MRLAGVRRLLQFWRPLSLAAAAAGLFILLSIYGAGREAPEPPPAAAPAPSWNAAEGDTTAETLRTLVAQIDVLEQKLQTLDDRQRAAGDAARQRREAPGKLSGQLQRIEQRLQELETLPPESEPPLPVGAEEGAAPRYVSAPALDARRSAAAGAASAAGADPSAAGVHSAAGASAAGVRLTAASAQSRPRFTIPANTIFFDAAALTALIGRIPVDGKVLDPFPVKVLVGAENLTAGGHSIPGLAGMLFSGTAVGDWTLRCVSVRLHNATFIFGDGSIRQLGREGEAPDGGGAAIAWLSDPQGLPCLPGKLISSAFSDAAQRILLSAAEGYAGARGSEAVSEIASVDGNVLRSLGGGVQRYAQHNAVRSALAEWRNFVSERYAAGFDAVYIAPGTRVVLHVSRQLQIDSSPDDRKLVHGASPERNHAQFD